MGRRLEKTCFPISYVSPFVGSCCFDERMQWMNLESSSSVSPMYQMTGKVVSFTEICVAHASILTMMAIGFERYYAICRPLEARYKCTHRRAYFAILVIWILALASTLPMLWITELQVSLVTVVIDV